MKKLIALFAITLALTLSSFTFANPELGNDGPIHFVLNQDNADWEYKTDSGQCAGGVVPQGDGTAWGEIRCEMTMLRPPWWNVPDKEGLMLYIISSTQMPDTPCEMFDSSNNAGNNQGHNVTQYNTNEWKAVYTAQQEGVSYAMKMRLFCVNGTQQ